MVAGSQDGSGISVGDYVGQLLGDMPYDNDSPESSDTGDAAGTPPAERTTETTETAAPVATPPEGITERTGTPPDDAIVPAPATPVTPEADPLASATPFTYRVDGVEKTFNGIKVLGTDGAWIEPAAFPDLMRRLGERDHLSAANQKQYAQNQQFERLSTWATKDAEGKDVTYQGQRGIVERDLHIAMLDAQVQAFESVFADTARMVSFLIANEDGTFTLDQEKVQLLALHAERATRQAQDAVRTRVGQLASQPAREQAPNYEALAPNIISSFAQRAGVTVDTLTPKDRQFLTQLLPRFERPATAQDVQGNPALRLGQRVIDASYSDAVKDRVELRAEHTSVATKTAAEQTRLATIVTASAKANQAKLEAASHGVSSTPVRKPTLVPKSADTTSDDLWDFQNRMASAPRSMSG